MATKLSKSSSVKSSSVSNISKSSWFITYERESKDVFVWKNDVRLKLNDGSSAGCVTAIQLMDADRGIVQVSHLIYKHTVSFS